MNKLTCIALLCGFIAALSPATAAHAQVKVFAPQLKVSINPATRLFTARYGRSTAERAFQDMGLSRMGNDPVCWSGANGNAIVFIHISPSGDGQALVYLVSASSTRDEAEYYAQGLQNKITSGLKQGPYPPPASRGVCPVQWCQIRQRSGRGVNPERDVRDLMGRMNWKETGRGPAHFVGTRGDMTLLARWETLPNNQLRYFVFVFAASDPQKYAARYCEDFAKALMSVRIDP